MQYLSVVQHGVSTGTSASGTSFNAVGNALPAAPGAGNTLLGFCVFTASASATAGGTGTPTGWTAAAITRNAFRIFGRTATRLVVAGDTGAATFACTVAPAQICNWATMVYEIVGQHNIASNGGASTTSPVTFPTTVPNTQSLPFICFADVTDDSPTFSAGYTLDSNQLLSASGTILSARFLTGPLGSGVSSSVTITTASRTAALDLSLVATSLDLPKRSVTPPFSFARGLR